MHDCDLTSENYFQNSLKFILEFFQKFLWKFFENIFWESFQNSPNGVYGNSFDNCFACWVIALDHSFSNFFANFSKNCCFCAFFLENSARKPQKKIFGYFFWKYFLNFLNSSIGKSSKKFSKNRWGVRHEILFGILPGADPIIKTFIETSSRGARGNFSKSSSWYSTNFSEVSPIYSQGCSRYVTVTWQP